MRIFTVDELWGPYDCEIKGPNCEGEAWALILTDEENKSLPEQSGPAAVKHILDHRLGKVACDTCLERAAAQTA